MKKREALKIALECVKLEYNRLLFGNNSKLSEDKRIRLAQAMAVLEGLQAQREMTL